MIVFDLQCREPGHRFEGWFASSDEFLRQQERALIACPECGSADVIKAVMAPNLGRKGNQLPTLAPAKPQRMPVAMEPPVAATMPSAMPPEAVAMFKAIAAMQAEALKSSTWVGDTFPDKARAIHYGEADAEPIHGEATPEQALELLEEGVEIAPILFPLAPPDQTN